MTISSLINCYNETFESCKELKKGCLSKTTECFNEHFIVRESIYSDYDLSHSIVFSVLWFLIIVVGPVMTVLVQEALERVRYDILIYKLTVDFYAVTSIANWINLNTEFASYWFGPLSLSLCSLVICFRNGFFLCLSLMGLEIIFVKFLYTNVWRNVGISNDDFWLRFLRLSNATIILFYSFASFLGNGGLGPRLGFCAGISNIEDLNRAMGGQKVLHPKVNPARFGLIPLSLILFLLVKSNLKKRELENRFRNRFGPGSMFTSHQGLHLNKMYMIMCFSTLVAVSLEVGTFTIILDWKRFASFPESGLLITSMTCIPAIMSLVSPVVFLMSDRKLRVATRRILKDWKENIFA